MPFILVFIALLLLIHVFLIENYRRWFVSLRQYNTVANQHCISFSIIIPARNEELNISACLETIFKQGYDAQFYEVIVVDDFSTDRTADVVKALQENHANLHLLQLEKLLAQKQLNSYKKKAIEIAIGHAKGDWIITTDADCHVPANWLLNFSSFIQSNNPVFIAAPVKYYHIGSFVSLFQSLDFMSLQGITAASVHHGFHTMCNGANLAYSKAVFNEVGGFRGIDNIASGDDMMLMHKVFTRYPTKVQYLHSSSSIVATEPMASWRDFLNQRIRWASKADKFEDKRIFWVLAFIYAFNCSFIAVPFLAYWHAEILWVWFGMFAVKAIVELRFMLPVARFFGETRMLWWFPVMQPIHILYTVSAGWLGKFGTYSWKGRTVN